MNIQNINDEYICKWLDSKSRKQIASEISSIMTSELYVLNKESFLNWADLVLTLSINEMDDRGHWDFTVTDHEYIKSTCTIMAHLLQVTDFQLNNCHKKVETFDYNIQLLNTDTFKKNKSLVEKLLDYIEPEIISMHINDKKSLIRQYIEDSVLMRQVPKLIEYYYNNPNRQSVLIFMDSLIHRANEYLIGPDIDNESAVCISYMLMLKNIELEGTKPDRIGMSLLYTNLTNTIEKSQLDNVLHLIELTNSYITFELWKDMYQSSNVVKPLSMPFDF